MEGSTPPSSSKATVIDLENPAISVCPPSFVLPGFSPPNITRWGPMRAHMAPSMNFGQMPMWGTTLTFTRPPVSHQNILVTNPPDYAPSAAKADGVQSKGHVGSEEPPLKKRRKPTKSKKDINLEDLTESQIEEAKLGGPWKEHWVLHLITLRGEMADQFSSVKQGVDNWGRLHVKLVSLCPDFNKDSEACRKKWAAIYKDYKTDKAINSISGSGSSEKCKWYTMVDEYMCDRPNVVSHAHGNAFEPEGIQPTTTLKDAAQKYENSPEKYATKRLKEDALLNECLHEVKTSGKVLIETMQVNEAAKLELFRSMQETVSKLIDKI